MKVNPVKTFVKKSLPWTFLVAGFSVATCCSNYAINKTNSENDSAKTYIKNNNLKRYNDLLERDKYLNTLDWKEEAKKIEIELKIDSVAKANYALGMQAVRDSLANANK